MKVKMQPCPSLQQSNNEKLGINGPGNEASNDAGKIHVTYDSEREPGNEVNATTAWDCNPHSKQGVQRRGCC